MPLMTWELWLARDIVADNPLPWQSPRPFDSRAVAQAMGGVLAMIGTPAQPQNPVESLQVGRLANHGSVESILWSKGTKEVRNASKKSTPSDFSS